jgi:hypothetical protein
MKFRKFCGGVVIEVYCQWRERDFLFRFRGGF